MIAKVRAPDSYAARRQRLAQQLHAASGQVALRKKSSNLFRDRVRPGKARLDVRDFNHILQVDPAGGWADAEGMTSYESLVLGTLAGYTMQRYRRFRGRALFGALLTGPLVMPEVITGLALLLLFVALEQAIGWPPKAISASLDQCVLNFSAIQALTMPFSGPSARRMTLPSGSSAAGRGGRS